MSNDPDFEAKKNRILELYEIADGLREPGEGDPTVVICIDEFGPLILQPHPGRQWAVAGGGGEKPRRRRRASYVRRQGVRHLLAAYDLSTDRLYGHIKPRKDRPRFKAFLRYVRSLHPVEVRIAVVLDNFSPHISADIRLGRRPQRRAGLRPLLRLVVQPHRGPVPGAALLHPRRHDHESHEAQARVIRRYIAWRNRNASDKALREFVKRANVA